AAATPIAAAHSKSQLRRRSGCARSVPSAARLASFVVPSNRALAADIVLPPPSIAAAVAGRHYPSASFAIAPTAPLPAACVPFPTRHPHAEFPGPIPANAFLAAPRRRRPFYHDRRESPSPRRRAEQTLPAVPLAATRREH